MDRFIRDYKLIITTPNSTIEVAPPLNIEFDCEKSINSFGLNRLNLRVYNLKESNRNQLVKDAEENKYIGVDLFIGYNGNIKRVFKGNLYRGYPERRGGDVVSVLECMDGLLDVKNSFSTGTASTKREAVDLIVNDMPNTEIGKITAQNQIYRDKVIMGNSYEEIKKLLQPDELMYIEDEKLYIIKDTELAENYITVINSETGLLNVPRRENQIVEVSTILNPTLKIGGFAQLTSRFAPYLNGNYRVESSSFKGAFEGQDWIQNLKLRQLEEV